MAINAERLLELHPTIRVFSLSGGKFLGMVPRARALEILELEPNALVTDTKRKDGRPALFVKDPDTLLMAGRRFRLSNFLPKSYVKQERLGGDGCEDWVDREERSIVATQHTFLGHRCFSLLPSKRTPGRPLLEGLVTA